jgi:hypothetical protein
MQDEIATLARQAFAMVHTTYELAVERVIGDRKDLYDAVWEDLMELAADDGFAEPNWDDD